MQNEAFSEDGSPRFAFGKNWYEFITTHFGPEAVASAKKHILTFLQRDSLQGIRMLDIGCGSGLHSIAALEAGSKSVHGLDYDINSVNASRFIYKKVGSPQNWTIEQGSVLDKEYMDRLGTFDLVYSWGVLHHTGDVWKAMEHAGSRVAPNGYLYIALYSADVQISPTAEEWLEIKKKYVQGSNWTKRRIEAWYIWRFMMNSNPLSLPRVIKRFKEDNGRGMRVMTDIRDWVGGWPMEFVWDKDAIEFYEKRGFSLVNIATGEANTEFLFRKDEA